MTALHQEAIELIQNIPDSKIANLVEILKILSSAFGEEAKGHQNSAYNRLLRYKGSVDADIDVKAELAKARDEKYADYI